jgi:hypothetical protein
MVASRRAAIAIALILLAATAAAFVYTEHKKLGQGPISQSRITRSFSPVCNCVRERAVIAFRLAEPQAATVRVVRENGSRVRTLAVRERFARGVVELTWDGRTDDGELAPDGRYRVTVRLGGDDTLVFPQRITLDTVAPTAELRRVSPTSVSSGEPVAVTYRLSEAGRAILYVDGTKVRTAPRRRRGQIEWAGLVGGVEAQPGSYELTVAARDLAGNVGTPSAPETVVILP